MEREPAKKTEINHAGRLGNLDILRSLAMLMVVVLHYLGKGGILGSLTDGPLDLVGNMAWLLEAFCIVAVNVYMLLSGYFVSGSSFKISRLLGLWLQLEFYSVGIGLLAVLCGWVPAAEVDTYFLLGLLFPVSMGHYWFMTAYIYLYILWALIGPAVKKMEQKQFLTVLGCLFFFFCITKSFLPVRFELDQRGYDCLWYLCMFLLGAYIRRFGFPLFRKKRSCLFLYLAAGMLIYLGTMVLQYVYLQNGSFSYVLTLFYEYNHLFNVLAALGLFGMFLFWKAPQGIGRFFGKIAPYTLGVYLVHENQGLRYLWPNWLGAASVQTPLGLLGAVVLAAVTIFAVGILADWCRNKLTHVSDAILSHVSLYLKLKEIVEKTDNYFK
ncbi:MAG: acyltransferase [Lachnospiraceae bacterium]|nr:acyltransferase [Lachnospiraceae bacterium]